MSQGMRLGFSAFFVVCTVFLSEMKHANAWTSEDMELFDLVEEIKENFYDLLGLNQQATTVDIKKAYRRLSLLYHPDKNKEAGAEEKFRRMVAVCETLKDDNKRKQYDDILIHGLPDWRQPIYYYRRVRKMGLFEMFLFLFSLLTIGQYIIAWSMYWERKYELEEVLTSKFRKKKPKKGRQTQDDENENFIADHVNQLPKPTVMDLFPIKLAQFLLATVLALPTVLTKLKEYSVKKPVESEEESDEDEIEDRVRKPRKRVKPELPEYSGIAGYENSNIEIEHDNLKTNNELETDSFLLKEWDELDTLALTKAMYKFPGGTFDRWEKIAATIRRPVSEVTAKAKSIKSSTITMQVPVAFQGVTGDEPSLYTYEDQNGVTEVKKRKNIKPLKAAVLSETQTISTAVELDEKNVKENDKLWSQPQQKALENALQSFKKGSDERWDKIAESVLGKTKEECMQRYKILVDLVKKKKASLR